MRGIAAAALAALPLAAGSPLFIDTIHHESAPIVSSVNSEHIPNSYIIKFKDHITKDAAEAHHSWVQDCHNERFELRKRGLLDDAETIFSGLKHVYHMPGKLLGYSGHFDDETIELIRNHPDVDYIELDSIVHTMKETPELEKNAPWGLARISHRDALGFGTFNKYLYSEDAGSGVDAYVIDTGTNVDHVDFEGRAKWGKTIPTGDEDVDGNGHGTHCSGTVAGKKFGVAKKANVYAVKVLKSNGSGTMSDVVKGVEWAATAHTDAVSAAKKGKKKGFKGSVANMSLGGGKSRTLDLAVNAAVDAGLHFAVAAGNDNADSCKYSPAAAENAVTVGASTLADERAYFSNFGECTDIFAPGLNILSTWVGSKYATNIISGTSMASPHICGLLAYLLSLQPASDSAYAVADISPKRLKADIIGISTRNALSDIPADTPNLLAWNGGGKTNYTEIVKDGGYRVHRVTAEEAVQAAVHAVEDKASQIKQDAEEIYFKKMHAVTDKATDAKAEIKQELMKIAKELEHLIEEA